MKNSKPLMFLKGIELIFFSFIVGIRSVFRRPKKIYILYPSIFISLSISLFPRFVRPYIVLDAFVSLYDTIVIDRKIIKHGTLLAWLLYQFEKHTYKSADKIIVDTVENAAHYSGLFKLDKDRFVTIPLSIPNLVNTENNDSVNDDGPLKVFFFGTFVPLHGISTIIKAAKLLEQDENYQFTIMGDGQESYKIENAIEKGAKNINWMRGHFSIEELEEQIRGCDIALGVFAQNEKTDRVIPYKLYYYLNIGKPIITARTSALTSLCGDIENSGMRLIEPDSPEELAHKIRECYAQRDDLYFFEQSARKLYDDKLSLTVIRSKLERLFSPECS